MEKARIMVLAARAMKKPAALELETLFGRSISMSPKQDLNHERADRHFKVREQQKADAPKATADYYAGLQRIRDRTQELRRLRVAREARKKAPFG